MESEKMKATMKNQFLKNSFYITSVIFSSAILSGVLIAETSAATGDGPKLSLCDGVWTTKTCEKPEKSLIGVDRPVQIKEEVKKPEPKVEEKKDINSPDSEEGSEDGDSEESNSDDEARRNRSADETNLTKNSPKDALPVPDSKVIASILHPLVMKASSIRQQFDKDFDITQVERFCNSKNAVVADCELKVSASLEKARAYEIKLQELALEEKQLESELAKNQTKPEQNSVSITQVTTSFVKTNNVHNTGLTKPHSDLVTPHPGLGRHRDIVVSRPTKEVKASFGSRVDQSALDRK